LKQYREHGSNGSEQLRIGKPRVGKREEQLVELIRDIGNRQRRSERQLVKLIRDIGNRQRRWKRQLIKLIRNVGI
jgi:hypothetical protein